MCGHLHVNLSCNELLLCLELSFHVEIERLDVYIYEANLEKSIFTSNNEKWKGKDRFSVLQATKSWAGPGKEAKYSNLSTKFTSIMLPL